MAKGARKDMLLDAAVRSYVKSGVQGLTTKALAKEAECSEALIYKYFRSKDELICEAYLRMHGKIDEKLSAIDIPMDAGRKELTEFAVSLWDTMFDFFVGLGAESLFYFGYRLSDGFLADKERTKPNDSKFLPLIEWLANRLGLDVPASEYRTFVTYTTGAFVQSFVNGDLPYTEENVATVRRMVFGGVLRTHPDYCTLARCGPDGL